MEQETRNSNLLNPFGNFFETQAHGIQSHSNNNNSNSRGSNLHQRHRSDANTTQGMNSHLLDVGVQLSSPGNNSTGQENTMSELDSLSVLPASGYSFHGNSSSTRPHDALYEAASQIGISTGVNPYSSSGMDFSSSQSHQILESFSTIDTSAAGNLSCAQSYVSLLQQQPGDVWTGQGDQGGVNFSSKQPMEDNRPQSNQSMQRVQGLSDTSIHQSLQKSTGVQHSQRMPANRGNQTQRYANPMMQYNTGSKHANDILMSLAGNDVMQYPDDRGVKNSREKKLTTTPIPSDADKSSCSGASSDGISGPEHSPDHITMTDQPPNGASASRRAMDGRSMHNGKQRNLDTSKSCCYGNMSLVNFGTINFAPVMDSNSVDVTASGSGPMPTSDSVVEISEVTSPLENIPLSPTTPTTSDGNAPSNFLENVHPSLQGCYTQMQNIPYSSSGMSSIDRQMRNNGGKPKSRTDRDTRKPTNNDRSLDLNNNSDVLQNEFGKNFASLSTVSVTKLAEKQKKSHAVNPKHKHNDGLRLEYNSNSESVQYNHAIAQGGNLLKPKVNADPTINASNPKHSYGKVGVSNSQQHSINAKTSKNPHQVKPRQLNQPGESAPVSNHANSAQARVWQTVTAVQGKKLPPMLSEQDRIPKRGRPSKKMMQQNLKVKAAQNNAVPVVKPQPAVVSPTSQASNLVAMYTINDKGVIEEIAPRPKESRRSKERNEAFLKYLDEIKISSKNQHVEGVKGAANKDGERQKKKSRSRNKVFGRQNAQPLTESGITQTMCTFSALAHQFKISHSIVERATENLLKSVAIKRNKEQNSAATQQQQKRKAAISNQRDVSANRPSYAASNSQNQSIEKSVAKHCESTYPNSTCSRALAEETATLSNAGDRQSTEVSVTKVSTLPDTISRSDYTSSETFDHADTGAKSSTPVTVDMTCLDNSPESPAVPLSPDAEDAALDSSSSLAVPAKAKHKKKKVKKHKKHKHSEITGAKKKRKDKDRKKKVKNREKLKSTPTPSASVSLNKSNAEDSPALDSPKQPSLSPGTSVERYPTSSADKKNTDSQPLSPIDTAGCDSPDDSSDEAPVTPKTNVGANSQLFASSSQSSAIFKTQPSFSHHSQSRIGFGTFSMEESPRRLPIPDKRPGTSPSEIVVAKTTDRSGFASHLPPRPNKKHGKYKKKKLLRKSKTCDPAFAATLDALLLSLKNVSLDRSKDGPVRMSNVAKSNVFLAAGVSDTSSQSSLLLWRAPGKKTTKKASTTRSDAGSKPTSMFPKNCGPPGFGDSNRGQQADFRLRKSKSASLTQEQPTSLSVFCRSPFFQKHGYVATRPPLPAKTANESTQRTSGDKRMKTLKAAAENKTVKSAKCAEKTDVEKVGEIENESVPEAVNVPKKRGRPPGKVASRAKKRKLSVPKPTKPKPVLANGKSSRLRENQTVRDATSSRNVIETNEKTDKDERPPDDDVTRTENSDAPGPSTDLMNDTLLRQIKIAIEASLPKHPSVNKEAIAKSVDAAVQSYLQNLTGAAMSSETPTTGDGQKRADKATEKGDCNEENQTSPQNDSSPKSNSDIHPKKLWACKHQDNSAPGDSDVSGSRASAKRGRGRPRKSPGDDLLKKSARPQSAGKIPTASATVVPSKRKVLTVKLQAKSSKTASKKAVSRPKIAHNAAKDLPRKQTTTITNQAALSCVNALCSIKAARVLAKSADKDDRSDIGMYANTDIGRHVTETIRRTVEIYSWDCNRKFEEACAKVAREMGFSEDADGGRSKNTAVKKSIESVIEKLKNKQARSGNGDNAGTESDLVIVGDARSVDFDTSRQPGRRQKIYEEVSPFADRANSKTNKVKHPGRAESVGKSQGVGVPGKKRRGRPPSASCSGTLPTKKRKLSAIEFSSCGQSSSEVPSTTNHGSSKGKSSKILQRETKKNNEFPRKKYLNAGLYSSTFKQNMHECSVLDTDADAQPARPCLPPPIDAGLRVRASRREFQLPFKTWWMYKHDRISVTQNPSDHYVEITKNVLTTPKSSVTDGDHICNCASADGEHCGNGCSNRAICVECDPDTCPNGIRCSNQAIRKQKWCESLERFKTSKRGWGLRTTKSVPDGSFILEYVGEVVSEIEFRKRFVQLYHAYSSRYCVRLDSTNVIDGYRMGNVGRFVNHSCEPNCEMRKWRVDGEYRIALFARRRIHANEELTFDYDLHAYDVDTQQHCRCGAEKCRGSFGGHNRGVSEPDLDLSCRGQAARLPKQPKLKAFRSEDDVATVKDFSALEMKPIPKPEMDMIRGRRLFLLRNLSRVRRREEEENRKSGGDTSARKPRHKSKTKKVQQSKEDKQKLESALTEMYTAIATCKDQNGVSVAIPFMNLPSKKKNPEYYERISDPIDLSIIEHNIVSNHYKSIESFDNDVQRVLKNAEKYHGKKSTLGKDVLRLKKAYALARGDAMMRINGQEKPTECSEASDADWDDSDNTHRRNEDHIRCICQIYRDEGLMVQCEKCYVWQHCDCIGVDPDETDHYLCEECEPRAVPREVKVVPPPPSTPPGHTYYLTLLRDDLLVKQGDCVYLTKDHRLSHCSNSSSSRGSYRNAANISAENLKIFRIEQLWTDERGDKYGYGYHFLRPHEIHHAPSRTFYRNELFASPFYEIVPLEAVVGLCCVMDLYTYCKGKPKVFESDDLYICDFRTDKAASSFNRITKKKYPICTKPHVFDAYKQKLTPKKDYQPHQVPEQYRRSFGRPPGSLDSPTPDREDSSPVESVGQATSSVQDDTNATHAGPVFGKHELGSTAWRKKQRLDGIASKLLNKLPSKGDDISYLLGSAGAKRRRKKSTSGR